MYRIILTVPGLVAVFAYILQYRDWLEWNKKFIYKVAPGQCKQIIADGGSEDLTHIGNGIVLISTGLKLQGKGEIKALNVNTNEVVTMPIKGAPDREDFMVSPHGISTWTNEKGQVYLYVLTHPPNEDKIEVFKVKENTVLKYKRTITDPKFNSMMNDLVAVGRDKFYITRFWFYRDQRARTLEYMTQNAWGGVIYFDGKRARDIIPSGLLMPNGINMSPDGKMIYVAESGKNLLHGYHRSGDNLLTKAWEYDADTFLDNIEVDTESGDLWIGCHPLAYRVFGYMNGIFGLMLPSQVLRFKMKDNMVNEVEEIYADDGSELNGSSAATYVNGTLVVGTVSEQAVVCDVKYMSPST